MGRPVWWCATSHPVRSSQVIPIRRQEVNPRYSQWVIAVVMANSA
jgi:hypothetical protein